MQIEVDVKCMETKFDGRGFSSFGDFAPFQIDWNQLKKIMQVGMDVTCMHTDFGGRGVFGFRDNITSQIWPNFPFGPWTIVHGHQKI